MIGHEFDCACGRRMCADLVGSERIRRHPHHRYRSILACGISEYVGHHPQRSSVESILTQRAKYELTAPTNARAVR
jgi:hypothetical protein